MVFEFDAKKSEANAKKHGISFLDAQALWHDDCRLEMLARLEGEERYVVIGRIHSQYWTAIITYRGEKIRLISVRRARQKEIEYYENL